VVHVEVLMCVDALGPGSPFADPNAPHPALAMPGGPIADFLPHLASLAHAFVGPHRDVKATWSRRAASSPWPSDEFRALVEAERGTALLGFSASARPEAFWLRAYGTRMSAVANLFETRLTVDRVPPGPAPLRPVLNGLREARDVRRGALSCLHRKLAGGGGVYEGLWELVARTYRAIAAGAEPPVAPRQVAEVNRLVADLVAGEGRS
jgi:predicted dehydrogenase